MQLCELYPQPLITESAPLSHSMHLNIFNINCMSYIKKKCLASRRYRKLGLASDTGTNNLIGKTGTKSAVKYFAKLIAGTCTVGALSRNIAYSVLCGYTLWRLGITHEKTVWKV